MKINEGAWSIILAGKWNRFIISPEWSAKNIFKEEKVKLEMAMNLGAPPRFSSTEIMMIPSEDRVIFQPLNTSDQCIEKAEEHAISLLNILSHTPVFAIGINFGFIESAPDEQLLELFSFDDDDYFIEKGYNFKVKNINRQLEIDKDSTINLSITNSGTDIVFDFNFNYNVKSTEEAVAVLTGNSLKNKEVALNILRESYKLTL